MERHTPRFSLSEHLVHAILRAAETPQYGVSPIVEFVGAHTGAAPMVVVDLARTLTDGGFLDYWESDGTIRLSPAGRAALQAFETWSSFPPETAVQTGRGRERGSPGMSASEPCRWRAHGRSTDG